MLLDRSIKTLNYFLNKGSKRTNTFCALHFVCNSTAQYLQNSTHFILQTILFFKNKISCHWENAHNTQKHMKTYTLTEHPSI